MSRLALFISGIFFLIILEIAKVYFIMPMPGSQQANTIDAAYWIHQHIWLLRVAGWVIILLTALPVIRRPHRPWHRWLSLALLAAYLIVAYLFNFRLLAEKMFYQPRHKQLTHLDKNKVPMDRLVMGIVRHDEARAYPVQFIGYHHQVRDTVGGEPVMITYCTVCRTGRAFSPLVGTHPDNFRLVGMDHFNAMFEDSRTGSWWQQATGKAIAGPLTGQSLTELPTQHMTLKEWAALYPSTLVMQPDSEFQESYDKMKPYETGKSKSDLTRRDSLSWHDKSWVVGITQNRASRAYDWNGLLRQKIVNDEIGQVPVVLTIGNDKASIFAWKRQLEDQILSFSRLPDGTLKDSQTGSVWGKNGVCKDGPLVGKQLQPVQAYQEFWHSWKNFHPSTDRKL